MKKLEISNEEYHSGPGLSRSGLIHFLKGPDYYQAYKNEEKKESAALTFGAAFHTYALEPHLFEQEYIISPEGMRFNTKAGIEFKKENTAKTIIKHDDFEKIKAMAAKLHAHPSFQVIKEKSEIEKSFFWEEDGVQLKARPDMVAPELNLVCDVKTTRTLVDNLLFKGMFDYGYDVQAAMCMHAAQEYYQQQFTGFVMFYVEKEAPYGVMARSIIPEVIISASLKYKGILPAFKTCLENDSWESILPTEIIPIGTGIIEPDYKDEGYNPYE